MGAEAISALKLVGGAVVGAALLAYRSESARRHPEYKIGYVYPKGHVHLADGRVRLPSGEIVDTPWSPQTPPWTARQTNTPEDTGSHGNVEHEPRAGTGAAPESPRVSQPVRQQQPVQPRPPGPGRPRWEPLNAPVRSPFPY
jgi:hypothetical protein